MEWSRRKFLRALASTLAASSVDPPSAPYKVYLPMVAESGGAYANDLGGSTWAIGNDHLEQRVAFSNGGLFTVSMRCKVGGRDWCSLVSSPVFFLREEDADLDSASGWSLLSFDASGRDGEAALRIDLQHVSRPIRVSAHFHIWADAPALRMWTEYENADTAERLLQGQSSCNLVLNPIGNLESVWVAPFTWDWRYTDDVFVVHHDLLTPSQQRRLVIGPYAVSDKDPDDPAQWLSCGWFAFHQKEIDAGLFGGVEWSGGCGARLALNGSGEGEISIGHGQPQFTHTTEPGERVTSPTAFIGPFEGSLDEATQFTRELAMRHYVPPRPSIRVPAGAELPYVMADTWCYGSDIDEASLSPFIERAAGIGVEVVIIDEGWEARIGDWVSHPTRFPSGLRATIDSIHHQGMAAGIWLAFGNVDPASWVAQEHPDWLAAQGGAPISGSFYSYVLCLSHAPARAWLASEIDRVIDEFDIDFIVQDFETIARCDNPAHGHQAGDGEYRNVLALWDLLAGVRARHPNVMIQNNWSGGRVMDFGMLRVYDTSLSDDYNQAARNRVASFGVTHFFPPAFAAKYMNPEPQSFEYQTRSYFFGGPLSLMMRLTNWDATVLSDTIGAYKVLRTLIRDGRIYHLHAPTLSGTEWNAHQISWDAIQSVEAGAARSVIFVGRGLGGSATFNVKPRGLDPTRQYDSAASSGAVYGSRSGADLMTNGIDVSLPERSHETLLWFS